MSLHYRTETSTESVHQTLFKAFPSVHPSRSPPSSSVQTSPSNSTSSDIRFYLTVYSCIAVANTVFTALRAFLFAYGTICAAKTIHDRLLKRVLTVRHLRPTADVLL